MDVGTWTSNVSSGIRMSGESFHGAILHISPRYFDVALAADTRSIDIDPSRDRVRRVTVRYRHRLPHGRN